MIGLNVLGKSAANEGASLDKRALLVMYARAHNGYAGLVSEQVVVDLGELNICPAAPWSTLANRVVDVRLPKGVDLAVGWQEVVSTFAKTGCRNFVVQLNPVSPAEEIDPLVDNLQKLNWQKYDWQVYRLAKHVRHGSVQSADEVGIGGDRVYAVGRDDPACIISARAAGGAYVEFVEKVMQTMSPSSLETIGDVRQENDPSLVLARLDDPRYEVLVALINGLVVASVGLLSLGEIGLIEQVFVLPDYRRRGIGRQVLDGVIDLAARSQFRHVFTATRTGDKGEGALYSTAGFHHVGHAHEWVGRSAAPADVTGDDTTTLS